MSVKKEKMVVSQRKPKITVELLSQWLSEKSLELNPGKTLTSCKTLLVPEIFHIKICLEGVGVHSQIKVHAQFGDLLELTTLAQRADGSFIQVYLFY